MEKKITEFSIVGEEGGIFEFHKPLTTLQEVYEKLKEIKETDRKNGFKEIKKKLLIILKANFIQYISNIKPNSNWSTDGFTAEELQSRKGYIINNIKIAIVNNIPDQWENGEVVYYITSWDNYIVM